MEKTIYSIGQSKHVNMNSLVCWNVSIECTNTFFSLNSLYRCEWIDFQALWTRTCKCHWRNANKKFTKFVHFGMIDDRCSMAVGTLWQLTQCLYHSCIWFTDFLLAVYASMIDKSSHLIDSNAKTNPCWIFTFRPNVRECVAQDKVNQIKYLS